MNPERHEGEEEVDEIDEGDDNHKDGYGKQGHRRGLVAGSPGSVRHRLVEIAVRERNQVQPEPSGQFRLVFFGRIRILPQNIKEQLASSLLQFILGNTFPRLQEVVVAPLAPVVDVLFAHGDEHLERVKV